MKVQDSAKGKRKLNCQVEGEVRNPVQKGFCCLITKVWLTLSLFWSSGALGTIPDVIIGLDRYGKMNSSDVSIDAENILHVCVSFLPISLGYHVNFHTFPLSQASDVFMC